MGTVPGYVRVTTPCRAFSATTGGHTITLRTVQSWPESVERVARVLREHAVDARLEEFPDGTPTAAAAARAAGCERAQIVKSLVFVCDELPLLALIPGDRRADAPKVAAAAGARYARVARPDEVVAATGFEPGAVAPFPAPHVSRVLIDRSLLAHELVWIGAGSDRHMAGIAPADLVRLTNAQSDDLAE
jgi:prolyl-tRNA editing enzyme YbaK/EbsC (Cys-tRNA(Pro) deacylase)